ncbi:uncharacterized protein LOC103314324 isoform X2 [Tribolium castaneum]|uniref:DNA endonuclease activator Ctp1 C-terminal domain-containing protein n=1 Tax=Tribolium castaneum TaxID=7070 RepID=A0A139WBR2_TRICA|nr:PREDICTED: uncharacterized protein LOC103314324 [Tribolium castaneum]KYB25364.1 hypothetical protein TcasGA2_TC034438 [Tribolium castaneum]|eukprot:XP_008198275.1 PREDICTED: uncharacterized protein LOC103314324 [Tribolium castaneum]
MPSDSYKDWISIYSDDIKTTWEAERSELRKICMIYCAFQTELNRLKTTLNDEISSVKAELQKRDLLLKRKTFKGLAQSEQFTELIQLGKENQSPSLKQLNDSKSEAFLIESPNTCAFVKSPPSPILSTRTKHSPPSFNKTPKCDDSNIMECSIIEDTPDVKPKKRPKLTQKRQKLKNRSRQDTTLTQMFLKPRKPKEIDSNLPSMSLDAMINLINESSGSETDDELMGPPDGRESPDKEPEPADVTIDGLEPRDSPVKEEAPKIAFEEVVRGKQRKKLKGWSCQECENYYGALNLPPEELEKRKNECSRHRRRFKRNETYRGFWDLTFGPSPRTQSPESMVFNYKRS